MVTVWLTSLPNGRFYSCAATGHAECGESGKDLLCAAVSMLLRTTASALGETKGLEVKVEAPEKGAFAFSAESSGKGSDGVTADAELRFVYTLLRSGFRALEKEYPGHIVLNEEVDY
jgi:uncharacterized protein YsxB (DUF464 family)